MQQRCLTREDRNAKTTTTDHAHPVTSKRFWPLLQIWQEFAPSLREKRKSSNSLAGICMKQAPGDWGPYTCCFAGRHKPASMPLLCGGPTNHPLCPIFWLCQKTYLKWEFPQEVVSKSGDAQRRHSLLKVKGQVTPTYFSMKNSMHR